MIISAGGVVVKRSKILLLKRKGNVWVLPKGHVETGESYSMAAIREVREETGIQASIFKELGWVEYSYRLFNENHHKRVYWFLMHEHGGDLEPQLEEGFIDVAYIPFYRAEKVVLHKNELQMIRRAYYAKK